MVKKIPLIEAIKLSNYKKVIELVTDHKSNINKSEKNTLNTAFHYACMHFFATKNDGNISENTYNMLKILDMLDDNESTDILNYLLDNGANVNAQNSDGETPLMLLIQNPEFEKYNKAYELIDKMFDKGLNVDIQDNKGKNALMHLFNNENKNCQKNAKIVKIVKILMEYVIVLNNSDKNGITLFMYICMNHLQFDLYVLKQLLYSFFSIYKFEVTKDVDNLGNNALMYMFKCYQSYSDDITFFSTYKVLTSNFSKITTINEFGNNLLIYYTYEFCRKYADTTCVKKNDEKAYEIAYSIFTKICNFLFINEVCINHPNKNGTTALHYACLYKNYDVILYLLDNNANVNICDIYQNSVLMLALTNPVFHSYTITIDKNDFNRIIILLIDKCADLTQRNIYGTSVLMLLCSNICCNSFIITYVFNFIEKYKIGIDTFATDFFGKNAKNYIDINCFLNEDEKTTYNDCVNYLNINIFK